MFRSLANRLTLWYAAVALGCVILVAVIYTFMTMSSIVQGLNQSIAQAARQSTDLIAMSRAQHHTLEQDAAKISSDIGRGFLRVTITDSNGRVIGGPDPSEMRQHRLALTIMSFFGANPQLVRVSGGYRIFIGPNPTRMEARLQRFWEYALLVGLIVSLIVWFAFRGITRRALNPLVEVTQALQRFGDGDFRSRFILDPRQRDELAALTHAFNSAVEQVSASFEERRKIELQMSQFIADAGHQLRTPLTVVMGFIEVLRKGTTRDPETENRIFDAMTVESRRMRTLIDRLVFLARLEQGAAVQPTAFDASALTASVVDSFKTLEGGERIRLDAAAPAPVLADKSELHEAISNLIDNALKYAPRSPVSVRVASASDNVKIDVQDYGPGISVDEQGRIFDRFYRGSPAENVDGSGLGLAIVRRAVERANGRVTVTSAPGTGTTFEIELPRAKAA